MPKRDIYYFYVVLYKYLSKLEIIYSLYSGCDMSCLGLVMLFVVVVILLWETKGSRFYTKSSPSSSFSRSAAEHQ